MNFEELYSLDVKDEQVLREYISFIENYISPESGYTEGHHIFPRSLFPEYKDSVWNIIQLKAEDHFKVHYLLAKALGGRMWCALSMMCYTDKDGERDYEVESKIYKELKEERSKILSIEMSGEGNPMYGSCRSGELAPMFGKRHSEEAKQKISEKAKIRFEDEDYKTKYIGENNPMFGKVHSEEAKLKMKASQGKGEDNFHFGKPKSEEHKKKIGDANRGRVQSEETRTKLSLSLSGLKRTEEQKRNYSLGRLDKKRVYNQDGKFKLIHKDELQNYFFRDNRYYDYP